MTKKKQSKVKNIVFGAVVGLAVAVLGTGFVAVATDIFRIEGGLDSETIAVVNRVLDLAENESNLGSLAFGGTTSDDWNVGKTLSVTGSADFNSIRYGTNTTCNDFDFGTTDGASGNVTTTATQLCDYGCWLIASEESTTMGLPTATTLIADCIPNIGDTTSVLIKNYSTSSVAITLLTTDDATKGTALISASTTADVMTENILMRMVVTNLTGATTTMELFPLMNAD